MVYRVVEGDGLRTTYAFGPRVGVSVKRDGPTSLELEFASSPVSGEKQEFRITRLRFQRVIEYGWRNFEFVRPIPNSGDSAFALIEIDDSAILADLRLIGGRPPGEAHHFRICFDDHGTYDVICESLEVQYDSAVGDGQYP